MQVRSTLRAGLITSLLSTSFGVATHGQEVQGGVIGGLREKDRARVKALTTELGLVMDWDAPPSPIKAPRPDYPKRAFAKGVEGTVVVEVVVDLRGRVARTHVLQSVADLDAAAVKCVRKWTFAPAKKSGKAVPTLVHVPVTFTIAPKARM